MPPESYGPRPEQFDSPETTTDTPEQKIEALQSENERLKEKIEELEKLAYFDPKTDLLNLNGLRHRLERKQLGRPENAKPSKGSMLLLDVDSFKIINDAYGHNVGDDILKAVAKHLKSVTRSTDLVVRWGGEEFVVVFDKTDSEGIKNKFHVKKEGEEVGRARFNVPAMIEGKETNITLSGGVVDFNLDDNLDEVFKQADEFLYDAKRAGRDRIIGPKENES